LEEDIDIHVSWIIILVLLMVSLATGWFPQLYPGWSVGTYWGVGLISALLLLPLRGTHSPLEGILFYLAVTNVLFGVFNLIPGFPLDGWRVLRSIVWKITGSLAKATRIASISGQVIAYLFILWGIWQLFSGNVLNGIWIGFIGWFLLSAAQSANTQVMVQSALRGVTVGEVMNPTPPTVPATISLQQLINDYFLPHGLRCALVM
jgi:Peptidase family M50